VPTVRSKLEQEKRHKARGVSLPPDMEKTAAKKALALDVSFSKYVQRLIRLDIEKTLIKP